MGKGFDLLVNPDADTADTLALIVRTVNTYSKSPFAKACAAKLCPKSASRLECIRNVFDYYCRNVDYVLDQPGIEKVYTPQRTIIEGGGDCKKSATFLASVLLAAGIEPVLKHVHYRGNDNYTHIYVIVPNPTISSYITLDPTNHCQFDKEVNSHKQTLYFLNGKVMELRSMGNPNNNTLANLSWSSDISEGTDSLMGDLEQVGDSLIGKGNGLRNLLPHLSPRAKQWVIKHRVNPHTAVLADALGVSPIDGKKLRGIELLDIDGPEYIEGPEYIFGPEYVGKSKKGGLFKKIFKLWKTTSLAALRGPFLFIVEFNVHNLAKHLLEGWNHNPNKIEKLWSSFGGNINSLKKVIISGAKKKRLLGLDDGEIYGPEFIGKCRSMGFAPAAALAGATPIIVAFANLLKQIKPKSDAASGLTAAADAAVSISSDPNFKLPNDTPVDKEGAKGDAPGSVESTYEKILRQQKDAEAVKASFFEPVGFVFKTVLLISILHINPTLKSCMESIAISAPLLFWGFKKLFTK